jgi:hypothetical protein
MTEVVCKVAVKKTISSRMKGDMSDPKSSVDQAQYIKNTTFRGEKWK